MMAEVNIYYRLTRNRMRYCIFSLFFLWLPCLHAQVPGYLGKRFLLGVESNITPSPGGMYVWDTPNSHNINFRPGISLEYVVSRRRTLMLSVHKIDTYMPFRQLFKYEDPTIIWTETAVMPGTVSLSGYGVSIGVTKNLNDFPAPLGSFAGINAIFAKTKSDFNINDLQQRVFDIQLPQIQPKDLDPTLSFGLGVELGRQRIMFDHVFIRYAAGMNLIFSEQGYWFKRDSFYFEKGHYFGQSYFDANARIRLFHAYLFSLKLGIGLVL